MSGPILLVGGDSEIGSATAAHLGRLDYKVLTTTRRRDQVAADRLFLDLTQPLNYWEPPEATQAACIFAAIARLQDCAADPIGSSLINVTQTTALIEKLLSRDIPVLFLSTDKVFDGTRPLVPAETRQNPVSEYGRQKAAAEVAISRLVTTGGRVATLRLAKVVSPGMPLLRQWIAAFAAGRSLHAFHDMTLAPTPMALVSTAVEHLISEPTSGIFQLTGPRDIAYTEFACYLAHKLGADRRLISAVSAHSAGGLPPGSSPQHTTLDSSTVHERFGIAVPDAWDVIDELIETCRS